jgi:anti-sigma B factor antagonist
MSNLSIGTRQNGSVTILDLSGKIMLGDTSADLRNNVRGLVEKGDKNIVLNLADVSSIDSSGLGELVASYVAVQRIDGEMKLLNLHQRIRDLMVMTKLLTVFDDFEDETEAVNSFGAGLGDADSRHTSAAAGDAPPQ